MLWDSYVAPSAAIGLDRFGSRRVHARGESACLVGSGTATNHRSCHGHVTCVAPAMSSRIEDYALIGDCRGSALVSRGGSIDWLCLPRFDSDACFAALLGGPEHGRWLIRPDAPASRTRVTRRYREGTLVLETTFETTEGTVTLVDCMALPERDDDPPCLVRLVAGRRGSVRMHLEWVLRFGYGRTVPWTTRCGLGFRAIAGPDAVWLRSPVRTRGTDFRTLADFVVEENECLAFSMVHAPSHLPAPPEQDPVALVTRSEKEWRAWSAGSSYRGDYTQAVQRSLVTLKALTFRPTGGIVAAPTTSLPERIGSSRNWDYRFCWIRDATITLFAFLVNGYTEEARAWRAWLLRALAGIPSQAQVLYGVAGERRVTELEVPWLPGYEGSGPVRIGNAAQNQLQLDTYGELMDAMFQCRHSGLLDAENWALECALLRHLATIWHEPDEGIWEIRGRRRQFTHSKLMVWVAFDRAVRSIELFGLPGPAERFRELRDEIHACICRHGFSHRKKAFTQVLGSEELDASLLLMPLVGFLPARDERITGTVEAIERELLIDDTYVLRYRTREDLDGLPEGEGAFLAASFWLVSNRVMQGRPSAARELFERLLDIRNDVGLLAEEYEPETGRFLGNFPQAFSHLALVDAAVSLSNVNDDPSEHRVHPAKTTRGAIAGGRP